MVVVMNMMKIKMTTTTIAICITVTCRKIITVSQMVIGQLLLYTRCRASRMS